MLVSLGVVAVFSLALVNTTMVLVPDMDQGTVSINIFLPIGSEVEEAAAIADQVAGIAERECPEMTMLY